MTTEKIQKHQEAITQAEHALANSRAHCDRYIRAVTTVSLPMLVTERKRRIAELSLHLVAIVKAVSAKILSSSDVFFHAMNAGSGSEYLDSASLVLESLSLPPLPREENGSHVNQPPPAPRGGHEV